MRSAVSPLGPNPNPRRLLRTWTAIEKTYKAALTAKGLDKEHIRFDARNGVFTLEGKVRNECEKGQAQQLAEATPNVRQVLNQIDVNR